jgi:hypothetical protein
MVKLFMAELLSLLRCEIWVNADEVNSVWSVSNHKESALIEIFTEIVRLVRAGQVTISDHGYDELAADDLYARDIVDSIAEAVVVENYPDYPKGSCVLVLQRTAQGDPIHVVWGIPKGKVTPAVLITAYKPDAARWEAGFERRKQ